ncbi:MAG: DUF222 domain-containing protein [Actinomycetota bacterium]
MSTLRSVLDQLGADDLRYASDDELEADFAELERAAGAVEGELARRAAEIDRRGSFRRDGYLSISSWLAHRFRMAFSAATQLVRMARALEHMPRTREALSQGEISRSAAAVLVAAQEVDPAEFFRVEEALVDTAGTVPMRDLKRAVAHWRQAMDHRRAEEDAEQVFQLRRLHVSPTFEGMVRVDGDLDPETGQVLITALRSVLDAEERQPGADRRTFAQRRADALGEICRKWLDSTDRPQVSGERPHVTIMVDLEALEGRAGFRCEMGDAGTVTAETARRWACDASIARVITMGRSEPLEAGRRSPVVPASLRRAVVVRDGGCRFPGCGRPHGWCDAHHVQHWADGGPTSLSNLVLLCRPHHRLIHQRFKMEMFQGRPVFLRPDGSPLEGRAPPATCGR